MILNVSGRTDVVAFYSVWFMNRIHEGYVDVRNPFYPKQVSRILFSDVEAIIFCTKNPKPMLEYVEKIRIPFIFQVTCTPYLKDIEPNVVDKKEVVASIIELSNRIGKENVMVRYDPILINDRYTLEYHVKAFERLCSLLEGYIDGVIVSFVDEYKNVNRHMRELNLKKMSNEDMWVLGESLVKVAGKCGLSVQTCFEDVRLQEVGFKNEVCVGESLARRLTGKVNFKKWKARDCGCVEMVDIGTYNTCSHFCKYCYANYDEKCVRTNQRNHDMQSSLLVGRLDEGDIIKIRKK